MAFLAARASTMVVVGSNHVSRHIAASANAASLLTGNQAQESRRRVVGIFDDSQQGAMADCFPSHHAQQRHTALRVKVQHSRELPRYIKAFNCHIAAITDTDAAAAQASAELCIRNGVTHIVNYSGCPTLKVPEHVLCEDGWACERNLPSGGVGRFGTDFEEQRTLGQGGFGVVVQARHRVDGKTYAVKKVPLPRGEGSEGEEHWMVREAQAMAALEHHPNLVRYHGSWLEELQLALEESSEESSEECSSSCSYTSPQEDSCIEGSCGASVHRVLFIQMELCDGNTLSQWLDAEVNWTAPLYEAVRTKIFDQITAGVSHIHAAGFVHRDIKPANIFLTGNLTPRIGDFGLCTQMDPETGSELSERRAADGSTMQGSTLYMAPELQQGVVTDKVDIFALGICLFELCHRFSTAMERIKLLSALRESGAMPQSMVGSPQGLAIQRMVAHDPSCRPSAAELRAMAQGGSQHGDQASTAALLEEIQALKAALKDRSTMVNKQAETIAALQSELSCNQAVL